MKKTKIIYWILTGLMSLGLGLGAVFNAMSSTESVELFTHLGFPVYMVPFVGVAKILGIIAILIPGFPRLKEWAYAGLTIDLVGATYSIIAVNGFKPDVLFMFLFIALNFASYYLWRLKN